MSGKVLITRVGMCWEDVAYFYLLLVVAVILSMCTDGVCCLVVDLIVTLPN